MAFRYIFPLLILLILHTTAIQPVMAQNSEDGISDDTSSGINADVSMSISEIAESLGIRGGDLAELLELPRSIDKDTALSELGITQESLDLAIQTALDSNVEIDLEPLNELPDSVLNLLPDENSGERVATLDTSMTIHEITDLTGERGGNIAEMLGLDRSGTNKDIPVSELGITQDQLDKLISDNNLVLSAPISAEIDTSMTIAEIAALLGVTENSVAHDLGVDTDVDHNVPVSELGVTVEKLDDAVHHITGHEEGEMDTLKYILFTVISLFATGFLLWWGIPKGADPKKRDKHYPQWVYTATLIFTVLTTGFWLGKSPNPMESVVKLFKSTIGLYESVPPYALAMIFFLILAIIGNKVICGWACPFGALEELIYTIPVAGNVKKLKISLHISNTIRKILFLVFILMIYGIMGNKGFVIYHYMNPFNLFNFDFSTSTVIWFLIAYLLISFFVYRPFCRFICPFGFLSWLLETVSLTRIRIDPDRCINCKKCEDVCPSIAAKGILAGQRFPADCFACMRCLRVCPVDAIHWRPSWGKSSPPDSSGSGSDTPKQSTQL